MFPNNIYPISGDPMHFSHNNTFWQAHSFLGQNISLLLCNNDLKDEGMFSLEERKGIASLYVPVKKIFVARNREEIRDFLINANHIVRGIRSEADMSYVKRLGVHYDILDLEEKLIPIVVSDAYKNMSSSKLKTLVKENDIEKAKALALPEVVIQIQEKYLAKKNE